MPTFHPNGQRTSVGDPGLATIGPSRRWGTRVLRGHEKTEGQVYCLADADAGYGGDGGWAKAVVEYAQRRFGAGYVEAVFGEGNSQGFAEATGTGAEELRFYGRWESAKACHGFKSCYWLEGADEYAAGFAFRLAGEVQTVVHSVDEIDVGETGRAEEYGVARGFSDEGMRGRIGEAKVGFDFGDASGEALAVEITGDELAEQVARDYLG